CCWAGILFFRHKPDQKNQRPVLSFSAENGTVLNKKTTPFGSGFSFILVHYATLLNIVLGVFHISCTPRYGWLKIQIWRMVFGFGAGNKQAGIILYRINYFGRKSHR